MNKSVIISNEEFQMYLKDLRKIPVINNETQIEYFLKLKNEKLSKSERKFIYDKIIVGNLKFVITTAKKFQGQGVDLLDLISEGNIGLINAIDRFEVERGIKFFTYASWWIRQSILECIYENSRTIRVPTNIFQEVQKQRNNNNIHDLESIMDEHDKILDLEFTKSIPRCVDLSSPINDDGDVLMDVIVNQNCDDPEDCFNTKKDIKNKVDAMLSVLDPREKTIIIKSFGLQGSELSLEDIGLYLGCTKERVRQLKVTALKKLRSESYELLKHI